jgi:hypothetical protein
MPPFFLLAIAFFLFFLLNLPFGKTNASSSHLSWRNFFGIWPWVFAESRAQVQVDTKNDQRQSLVGTKAFGQNNFAWGEMRN